MWKNIKWGRGEMTEILEKKIKIKKIRGLGRISSYRELYTPPIFSLLFCTSSLSVWFETKGRSLSAQKLSQMEDEAVKNYRGVY